MAPNRRALLISFATHPGTPDAELSTKIDVPTDDVHELRAGLLAELRNTQSFRRLTR
jgi:hypothetical protein